MFSNFLIFFFNDTATTEIYTLSLHDALPIYGQEVLMYHTSPVLFSSDGTGISDGIEVQTGTLGGSFSAKLAAALKSLEVKPGSFILNVNTIQGLAAQQLSVLGHLIDSKTALDLTSTLKGNSYSSCDFTIC